MNSQQQREFENQKSNSYLKDLQLINTDKKYIAVRKCYKSRYDEIFDLLKERNPRTVIEDIEILCGCNFEEDTAMILRNINRGIISGIIDKGDFK